MIVKDYYKILQIDFDSDIENIKKSYRNLVKQYHPDLKLKDSDEYIKDINEAYKILSNEAQRKEYNKVWKSNFGSTQEKYQVYTHIPRKSGIKEELLDVFLGIKKENHKKRKIINIIETISLKEAFLGTKLRLELANGDNVKKIVLNIPSGIMNGEVIRIIYNDSYEILAEIRIDEGKFKIKGIDLYSTIDIYPWDAKLGKKIEFESIAENIFILVPENTENNKEIKIFGKGYINKDGQRGDLYLKFNYIMPKEEDNPEEIELYKKLREFYEK